MKNIVIGFFVGLIVVIIGLSGWIMFDLANGGNNIHYLKSIPLVGQVVDVLSVWRLMVADPQTVMIDMLEKRLQNQGLIAWPLNISMSWSLYRLDYKTQQGRQEYVFVEFVWGRPQLIVPPETTLGERLDQFQQTVNTMYEYYETAQQTYQMVQWLLSGDRNQIMDRMKQQGLELTEQQLGELKNLDQQEALRYLTELAR